MRHVLLVSFVSCVLSAGYALAEDAAPMLPSDGRIKVLVYDESDVYTITTKYGYQTNIVFGKNEEIETISVGDRSLWQIIPAGNRMFIRPMQENVTTNMTILTSRHSYQFDLKSLAEGSKDGSNIYVAKFMYPEDMPPAPPAPPVLDTPPLPAVQSPPPASYTPSMGSGAGITRPVHPNYNYTYAGSDDLAPVQVYDNGQSTFIKYRTLPSPLPQIYMVEGGKEQQTTYYIKDGMLVVNEVAGELALKSGKGTVAVYNELRNPR